MALNRRQMKTRVQEFVILVAVLQSILQAASTTPILVTSVRANQKTPKPQISQWLQGARLSHMCTPNFHGREGSQIKDFRLVRVFVTLTPGLTYPGHHDLDKLPLSKSDCDFRRYAKNHLSGKLQDYAGSLATKQKVHQTGKPTSFKSMAAMPEVPTCQPGMLTPQGIHQLVAAGEAFLDSYRNKLMSLLQGSPPVDLAKTAGDSTLYQSLTAFLYGLLNHKMFLTSQIGKLSHNFGFSNQKQTQLEEHLHYFVESAYRNEHHIFKDNTMPTSSRSDIDAKYGSVSAKNILSHLSLSSCPGGKLDGEISEAKNHLFQLQERLFSLSDSHNQHLSVNPVFRSYAASRTNPLRATIKSWFTNSHKKQEPLDDLRILAVDDLYMFSLLTSLNVSLEEHLFPASRLVIEQFVFDANRRPNAKHTVDSYEDTLLFSKEDAQFSQNIFSKSVASPKTDSISDENEESIKPKSKDLFQIKGHYIRLLWNGKVITENVTECQREDLISLGLCSTSVFLKVLGLQPELMFGDDREEL